MNNTILVLGATGKTGKRVVARLQKMNLSIRLGSRNATPAFDWEDASTWDAVLTNVQKVYISFQPDVAMPGAQETIRQFVQKSIEHGIEKLVLVSGRGEKESELCEAIVMNSGIDWTIARASFFMQNFSEGFFLESILAGHVVMPEVSASEPFVDTDDIADVVTAALTSNDHTNKLYEVTGPRLITFEQAVAEIAMALKRPIQFEAVSMEEYVAVLRSYEVPENYIWLLRYIFSTVLDGRNESLAQGVEEALHRKPTDFSNYVKHAVESAVWNTAKQMVI
jgi:uncharacterized protein YbjT (DUF2867 family)